MTHDEKLAAIKLLNERADSLKIRQDSIHECMAILQEYIEEVDRKVTAGDIEAAKQGLTIKGFAGWLREQTTLNITKASMLKEELAEIK